MSPQMNKLAVASVVALALAAVPATVRAQTTTWSNATSALPVVSTIKGGPWTLSDNGGGLVTPTGSSAYCLNGAVNTNANASATTMAPYYFPFVMGSGANLTGYFDYRPSSVNEATVAASSADAGKTWTYLGQALQLTAACPAANAASGGDSGLGHPFVMSFGGANFLYLLDRRGGHVDVDGLTVHRITPTLTNPLKATPPLNATAIQSGAASSVGVIAGWTFDSSATPLGMVGSPAADVGPAAATAVAKPLGMTNNYYCSATPNTATLAAGFGSISGPDVESDSGSSVSPSNGWRVRGAATTDFSAPCNGWSLAAPQYTQGAEFDVDTTGHAQVVVQYDWFSTKEGFRDQQAQYSLNVNASTPVWTNIGSARIAIPKGWVNGITLDLSGIAGAGNNPNFGIRFVGIYDPAIAAGSYPIHTFDTAGHVTTTLVPYALGQAYASATLGGGGKPALYNNNSGNWRFDNVKVLDKALMPVSGGVATTDYTVETTGLLNPDGILAVIPNSYPRQVLYVRKQLTSAPTGPTACTLPTYSGKVNTDVDTIRLAYTYDGVNFTDAGLTNLIDPTTTSATGLRYAAPNGSIVKLQNGKFGLFFGAGNCQDGDSDGFHAIMYAQNSDSTMLNWTLVNGMNNPIAEVGYGPAPATAPLTGTSSQLATGQNGWFGGRVYTPQAIYQDANHISLIFDGYDYLYENTSDLSSYRTMGQITLTSSLPLSP